MTHALDKNDFPFMVNPFDDLQEQMRDLYYETNCADVKETILAVFENKGFGNGFDQKKRILLSVALDAQSQKHMIQADRLIQ